MKYAVVIEPSATGYAATPVQFAGLATAGTREEVIRLAAEQVALGLLECRHDAPPAAEAVDLSDYEPGAEVVMVEPAAINPVSLAIEAELKRQHIKPAELARRAGMTPSVVSRLTDPFYFGHSLKSLNQIGSALGREVKVSFTRPVRAPEHQASV